MWHSKSLSTWSLRLCAWIYLLIQFMSWLYMANLFPPDLVRFQAWIWPSTRNKIEVPANDKDAKPRSYTFSNNISLWRLLHATDGARYHQEGTGVQKHYYIYERYESLISNVTTPDSLTQPNSTLLSFAIWTPPHPPSKLRLLAPRADKCLSTIQPTWGEGYQLSTIWVQWWPEWRVISYQRYDKDDLSEELLLINNTSAKMADVVDNLCGWWPM